MKVKVLYPEHVHQILSAARDIGFTTSLITNGSLISPELTQKLASNLSMLGVSLDSGLSNINRHIGRQSQHGQLLTIEQLEEAIKAARSCNPTLQIKLNTVATHSIAMRISAHWFGVWRLSAGRYCVCCLWLPTN